MKRRNIVRLVSFLCAVIVALFGVILKDYKKQKSLRLQIENNYSRNLNEFSASINNISLMLKKARYATTPSVLSKMASEILSETEISKSALSQLPYSARFQKLNLFLSQAGNYAFAVSSKLYETQEMPTDFAGNITTLSETAEKISEVVNNAQITFDNSEYWTKEIEQKIEQNISDSLSSSLQKIENKLNDYPTLVYDGPYSDHLINSQPQMLINADYITESEALKKAYEFLGQEKGLKTLSDVKGDIEAYHFGNDSTDITVSKKGGYVVYLRKSRQINESILSYSQALAKAKRFLGNQSLENFLETYYFIDEGVCVISFAFLDGETICYTDLIKVGVAMDSGEVMLYEAGGYLSNHKSRAFESAEFTEEQAREKVSYELKINKVSKVLIPSDSGEKRCYEFSCSDTDTDVLVYINVLNLKEEEILILLKNDGGMLAK